MRVITYVQFNKPVQVNSRVLEHWSFNMYDKTIRVEEEERGLLLYPGRMEGDAFVPTGDRVRVPWLNVVSMLERPADEAKHPDAVLPSKRVSRTRLPQEVDSE